MVEETNNQALVCNIYWGKRTNSNAVKKMRSTELPVQISLDIPAGVVAEISKNPEDESLIVEQFVCNLLYKKFGHEVNSCQIWLPLKD